MNTNTPITTAARRIARYSNDGMELNFGPDGTPITLLSQAEASDPRTIGIRGKYTQREAQDVLDSHAYAAEHYADTQYDGYRSARFWYLDDLKRARDDEKAGR